jgi:hypothetical protein
MAGQAVLAIQMEATAEELKEKVECYYMEASEKIQSFPEISRILKRVGGKHSFHLERLKDLRSL